MSVNEAKGKFEAAKKMVERCTKSIQTLQAKADQLQDSLPNLSRAVEAAEKEKQVALDNFAMTSNKQTESSLRIARTACEQAARQRIETNELIEATSRGIKKTESDLQRLNAEAELTKRKCWESVFNEVKEGIPKNIFGDIKTLFVAGGQCCMTRQFILDSLLPNLNPSEYQAIRDDLTNKYNIE